METIWLYRYRPMRVVLTSTTMLIILAAPSCFVTLGNGKKRVNTSHGDNFAK